MNVSRVRGWKLWAGLLAVALCATLLVPLVASAQEPENRDGVVRRWARIETSPLQVAADLFGIEPMALSNRMWAEGKSLFDLAPDYGYTADELVAAAVAATEQILDNAVHDGTIAQRQADEKLAAYQDRLEAAAGGEHDMSNLPRTAQRLQAARDWVRRLGRGMLHSGATLFGVDPQDLAAEVRGGSSLLEAAESRGFDTDDLISAFLADHSGRLEEAVEAGKLSPERAEKLADRFEGAARRALEGETSPRDWLRRQTALAVNAGFARLDGSLIDVAAELLSVEPAYVAEQMQNGVTLSTMLDERGHTAQDLADAFLSTRQEILDELVAAGRVTDTRADQVMNWMEARVERALTEGNWSTAGPR